MRRCLHDGTLNSSSSSGSNQSMYHKDKIGTDLGTTKQCKGTALKRGASVLKTLIAAISYIKTWWKKLENIRISLLFMKMYREKYISTLSQSTYGVINSVSPWPFIVKNWISCLLLPNLICLQRRHPAHTQSYSHSTLGVTLLIHTLIFSNVVVVKSNPEASLPGHEEIKTDTSESSIKNMDVIFWAIQHLRKCGSYVTAFVAPKQMKQHLDNTWKVVGKLCRYSLTVNTTVYFYVLLSEWKHLPLEDVSVRYV